MTDFPSVSNDLILASGSSIRKTLLRNAGLNFEVIPAEIDEEAIRAQLETESPDISPLKVAEVLAQEKAKYVSLGNQEKYVIGSDQILAFGSEIYSKPEDLKQARQRLLKFSGKTHQLHTAVSVACNGKIQWSYAESVKMTMRDLSSEFVDSYLATTGEEVCKSVGAYQLEGLGVQLFSYIEGNYFSILGICLLPLLEYLREEELVEK